MKLTLKPNKITKIKKKSRVLKKISKLNLSQLTQKLFKCQVNTKKQKKRLKKRTKLNPKMSSTIKLILSHIQSRQKEFFPGKVNSKSREKTLSQRIPKLKLTKTNYLSRVVQFLLMEIFYMQLAVKKYQKHLLNHLNMQQL